MGLFSSSKSRSTNISNTSTTDNRAAAEQGAIVATGDSDISLSTVYEGTDTIEVLDSVLDYYDAVNERSITAVENIAAKSATTAQTATQNTLHSAELAAGRSSSATTATAIKYAALAFVAYILLGKK